MPDIISTVGIGKDYATLTLWNAGDGGLDPGVGFTAIAECSGYLGAAANINGTFIRGATIRGDVVFDGTNDSLLSNAERLTISSGSGINVEDLRIFTNNQFVSALNYNADFIVMDRVVIDNTTTGVNALDINGTFINGHIRNFVARGGSDAVMAGYNQGANLTNGLIYGAADKGVEGGGSAPMVLTNIFAFNNGGQDVDSVGGFTLVDVATEDSTGTYTGYTNAELVDFAGGDLRTKSTSDLATLGTPFIGAFLESGGGSGVSLTVTETKSSSLNNSSIEILANLSIIVTETKSPSINSSLLAISSQGVTLAVTEMKSSSIDSAVIDITSNISALVTEVKSSRADFSATQIQRDIESIVTEVRASSIDSSILNIPVTITISKKNMVRVKRVTKTVRVKRNNKIIRVK